MLEASLDLCRSLYMYLCPKLLYFLVMTSIQNAIESSCRLSMVKLGRRSSHHRLS